VFSTLRYLTNAETQMRKPGHVACQVQNSSNPGWNPGWVSSSNRGSNPGSDPSSKLRYPQERQRKTSLWAIRPLHQQICTEATN